MTVKNGINGQTDLMCVLFFSLGVFGIVFKNFGFGSKSSVLAVLEKHKILISL